MSDTRPKVTLVLTHEENRDFSPMIDPTAKPSFSKKENSKLLLVGGAIAVLIGFVTVYKDFVLEAIQTFQGWTEQAGAFGAVVYAAVYAIATVSFLPGWIFTVGTGVIYGVLIGSLVVSVGSTLGATLAFLLARTFLRDTIARKVQGNDSFRAIDEAIGASGWKIVFLIRLSPIFPFNLLNYALGLTKIPVIHYILASWIGMLPGTIMYVYLGAIGHALTGQESRPIGQQILFVVGLVATILVTVLVGRIAKMALMREAPNEVVEGVSD